MQDIVTVEHSIYMWTLSMEDVSDSLSRLIHLYAGPVNKNDPYKCGLFQRKM